MITITSSIDLDKWSDFVKNHPNGNIFQSPEMLEVYRKTKNYPPSVLFVLDDTEDIVALAHVVIIQETGGILGGFTSRSIIQGGPLYKNTRALQDLMGNYNEFIQKKAIYSQVRNLWDTGEISDILKKEGYVYEDHLNYLIDINRSEEDIWGDISKNRRKGITRAERDNIVVRKILNLDELEVCYGIIKQTYQNVKLPVADISLFKAAYEILEPKGMADFYIALKDCEPVGTRMVLKYHGIIHDWYAGSKKDVMYVDEAIVWKILQDNSGKYNIFEFGGAGHPDKEYGVREFKKRFGGKEVNFGRYEKIHSVLKRKIINAGVSIYRGIS
jgi:lipid II:glycine glycyltransferase (peptidoglycan interpeptide bridge formation enzyme)